MTSEKSDIGAIVKHMEIAYRDYFKKGGTYSVISTDLMKVSNETGDLTVEQVYVVLLNPATYEILKPVLPILHEPEARQVWLHVLEETLAQLDKLKDGEQPN
jgi:hypothetical protein